MAKAQARSKLQRPVLGERKWAKAIVRFRRGPTKSGALFCREGVA
jgi:hypothetical protein